MSALKKRITDTFFGEGLRSKIMASAALSSMMFVVGILIRIVSTVILTRLLAPEIFGVFAVVLMFIHILEQFSDIGVRPLILSREGDLDDSFLQSCWTAQVVRGVLIFLLCVLLALGIGWGQSTGFFGTDSSYADPALPLAIAAIGFTSVITGFQSIVKFVYEREMKFGQVSKERLIAGLTATTITILLAFWLRNIWALVIGNLVGATLLVILSYAMFRGAPMRLNWNYENFRLIIQRGKWIVGQSGLTSIVLVADRMILGLSMSASTFGFYYIARQIVEMVEQFLGQLHSQMGLQVFTALHKDGDNSSLQRRYYRYRIAFDGLAMFGAGAFFTFGPALVDIVYDDRYANVGTMIQIFALGLVLIGPGLLREAFAAQRRFREMTFLTFVRMVTIWAGLVVAILVFDSVTAALFVVALHRVPEVLLLLLKGRQEGWVSWLNEVRLLPAVLAGMLVGWGMAELWQYASGA